MTGLLTDAPQPVSRTGGVPGRPRSGTWGPAAGAGAAVLAAAVGFAVVAAVTVLLWAAGPHPGEGLGAAPFRGAAAWWLLGQHATATVPAGTFGLAPGALMAALALLNVRTVTWASRVSGAHTAGAAVAVAAGFVAAHAILAVAAAGFGTGTGPTVAPSDALRAGAVFAAATAGFGAALQTDAVLLIASRITRRVRPALRAGAASVAVLLAGGSAALGVSLAVHHDRTAALFESVGGGTSGALGVLALCLLYLPNAVLWAVGLAAGPGFALGAGSGVDLTGARTGALPSFPLLGALPEPGGLPPYAYLLAAVPLAAGAVAGWTARPAAGPRSWGEVLALPLLAAAGAAAVTGTLAGLSAGGAGGRLAPLGPSGLAVGLALAAELAAVALAVAAGRYGWARLRAPAPVAAPPTLPTAGRPADGETVGAETSVDGAVVDDADEVLVDDAMVDDADCAVEDDAVDAADAAGPSAVSLLKPTRISLVRPVRVSFVKPSTADPAD